MSSPDRSELITVFVTVYIEGANSLRPSKAIGVNTTTALELKAVLVVFDTELRLKNILDKEIQSPLKVGCSNLRVVAKIDPR